MHNMITKVLGNYDEVKNIVSHPSFIGVVHQPNTPIRTKTQGDLFGSLIPPPKPEDRERAKERERQQQKEKEREKEQQRTNRPGGPSSQQQPQNNGAFPSNSKPKVKDPRDRDNVFDKFLPSDNGPGGPDQPANRKSRKDSKSGDRHKDRAKDRTSRGSASSEHDVTKHKASHHERDRRSASREKDRRSRERPPSLSDLNKSGSQDSISKLPSDDQKRNSGAAPTSSSRPTSNNTVSNQKSSTSASGSEKPNASTASTKSPKQRSIDRQDSSESRSSTNDIASQKANAKGAPSGQSNKGADPTFAKPINGMINGMVRRKEDGSNPRNKPKLVMPKQVSVEPFFVNSFYISLATHSLMKYCM